MSTPRRKRWIDVLRRTTGVGGDSGARGNVSEDAALWTSHEQATKSLEEANTRAERVAASVARQRSLIESASERANVVSARSEGAGAQALRVGEAFERLGVVALNAGLEGARAPEPHGRALLLLSDEIRANVVRGADAAQQIGRVVEEIASEASECRKQLERSRAEVGEVAQESAQLRAASQTATKALDDLAGRLKRATGIDPEIARAVSLASEHARGLMTALSALSTAPEAGPVLGALRPVLGPLASLLGEMEKSSEGSGEGTT